MDSSPETLQPQIIKPVIHLSISSCGSEQERNEKWVVSPQNDEKHLMFYKTLMSVINGKSINSVEPFELNPQTREINELLENIGNLSQDIYNSHPIYFVREDADDIIKKTNVSQNENGQTMVEIGQTEIDSIYLLSPFLKQLHAIFNPQQELTDDDKVNFARLFLDYLQGKNGQLELTSLVVKDPKSQLNHEELTKKQLKGVLLNYFFLAYRDFIEAKIRSKQSQTQPQPDQQPKPTEGPLTRRINKANKARNEFFEQLKNKYLERLADPKLTQQEKNRISQEISARGYDPEEFWKWINELLKT